MRDSDYAALAQFRYQIRNFLAFSEEAAAAHGIDADAAPGAAWHQEFCWSRGPSTVGDVARFLLIRHHSAVELINRLAKLGW